MAGFGRFAFEGEFFGQSIVNVLWFRSDVLTWLEGNVFQTAQNVTNVVATSIGPALRACMLADYTLLRVSCTPYNDQLHPVLGSPIIASVNLPGILASAATSGAPQAVTLGLKCGPQHQITGVTQSRRNRGYLSVGPVSESVVDNYAHVDRTSLFFTALQFFADTLLNIQIVAVPSCDLVPIRIHRIKTLGIWSGVTYSDIQGYELPRVATYRRSRQPEA